MECLLGQGAQISPGQSVIFSKQLKEIGQITKSKESFPLISFKRLRLNTFKIDHNEDKVERKELNYSGEKKG